MTDENPQAANGIEYHFNRRNVIKGAGLVSIGAITGFGVGSATATTVLGKERESFEDADVGDPKPADPWFIMDDAGSHRITDQHATHGNQTFYIDGENTLNETRVGVPVDFTGIDKIRVDIFVRRGNPDFGDFAIGIDKLRSKIIAVNNRAPGHRTSNVLITDVEGDVSGFTGTHTLFIRARGDNRGFFDNLRFLREEIEVTIDIKPCSDPNAINPNDRGVIPVAIKHTDEFDPVERVNVDSIRFGTPDVVENGGGASPARDSVEDVVPCEGDGRDDLVLHFPTEDTGFDGDEDTGRLEGETNDGTPLFGTDSVKLVGR